MKHHPTNPPNPADPRALTTRLADWRAFAAAGASLVAIASTVEADIIYDDPAVKPTTEIGGASVANPFSVDGVRLNLTGFDPRGTNREGVGISAINPVQPFFFTSRSAHGTFIKNYPSGAAIGGGNLNTSAALRLRTADGGIFGPFQTGKTGFAGFQLPASKGGGEGWIRFEVTDGASNGGPSEAQAIDWAYNDAGGGINAGQVPEPRTTALALMAAGSVGVLAWRKRRGEAAVNAGLAADAGLS